MQIRYYALLWSVVDGSDESNTMLQAVHQLKLANSVSGGSLHQQVESLQDAEASQNQTLMIQREPTKIKWTDVKPGCNNLMALSDDCGKALTTGLTSMVNLWANKQLPGKNYIDAGLLVKDVLALVFPLSALALGLVLGSLNLILDGGTSQDDFKKKIMKEVDLKIDAKIVKNFLRRMQGQLDSIFKLMTALRDDLTTDKECGENWVPGERKLLENCNSTEMKGKFKDIKNQMRDLSKEFRFDRFDKGSEQAQMWAVVATRLAPRIAETQFITMMLFATLNEIAGKDMMDKYQGKGKNVGLAEEWVLWAEKHRVLNEHQIIKDFDKIGNQVDPWIDNMAGWYGDFGGNLDCGQWCSLTGYTTCEWHSWWDKGKTVDPDILFGSISLSEELKPLCRYSLNRRLLVREDEAAFDPLGNEIYTDPATIHRDLVYNDFRNLQAARLNHNHDWCTVDHILGKDHLGKEKDYNLCVKKHVDMAKLNVSERNNEVTEVFKREVRGYCEPDCATIQNSLREQFLTTTTTTTPATTDLGMIKSNTHGCCQGTALTGGRVGYASASECVTECVSSEQCMAISYDNGWCTRYTDCVSIGSACGASSSTWETWLNKNAYTFKHDGHCATATGWMGDNTQQNTISDCASHCSDRAGCEYFAYAVGSRACAEYTLAGGCTDDGQWQGYKSYQMLS